MAAGVVMVVVELFLVGVVVARIVHYGDAWCAKADPAGLYAVSWIEATSEICATRHPDVPARIRRTPASLPASAGMNQAWTVEILGWSENQRALDAALAGWQAHMGSPDSLSWVRQSLAAAEANRR